MKHGSEAISIIIDVSQSRLHTLAHTVLAVTAPTEHDKFCNMGKKGILLSLGIKKQSN